MKSVKKRKRTRRGASGKTWGPMAPEMVSGDLGMGSECLRSKGKDDEEDGGKEGFYR